MPYLSFATICLLFGSNFILMDRANQALGPVAVGAGRLIGAGSVLLIAWWLTAPKTRVPKEKWLGCVLVGVVANGYPYVAQPFLLRQGFGHSFFGMMVAFTPLLTILASIPLLGIRPSLRQLAGVLAGLGFMGLLMFDGSERGISLWMLAMSFTIPLSYACANTYLRRELNDVPSTALSATMLLIPMSLLTPLAMADPLLATVNLASPAEPTNWTSAIIATAILGMLGTGLTMWLFVRLVQQQGPLFAGMVTYVVPVVAMSWGLFDGEKITTRQIIAIAGVLAMVALVQYGAAVRQPKTLAADSTPASESV